MAPSLSIIVRGTNRGIDVRQGTRLTAGRAADCDIYLDDRDPVPIDEVVGMIRERAGSHFDPEVAELSPPARSRRAAAAGRGMR